MVTRHASLLTIPVFLFILLWSARGYTQKFTQDDKQRFRDSIIKVRVWTRIANDTAMRFYLDAMNAVKSEFNRKGYRVEQVFFDKKLKLSQRAWERHMIVNLSPNEAFLDLLTRIEHDTSQAGNIPARIVRQISGDGGAIIGHYNEPVITGDLDEGYRSVVNANLYISRQKDTAGTFTPVFSKKNEIESGDISLAVNNSLSGIPRSHNPAEIPVSEQVPKNEKTRLEITGIMGYVFPSTMDIISTATTNIGKVGYSPCAHYGVEISFGLSRSVDVLAAYDREDTKFTVTTTDKLRDDVLSVSINYILVGAVKNFRVSRFVSPFISLSLGSVNCTPKNNYYRDVWYFTVNPEAGVKFYLSKHIGVRIQTYCMYQVHPLKAPFLYSMERYYNEWDSYSNLLQVGLSGGIIFRIGATH